MTFLPALFEAGATAFSAIGGANGAANALSIGSSILSGFGALQTGSAQSSAYQSQAVASIYNANVLQQQARQVQDQAAYQSGEIIRGTAIKVGDVEGAALENGIELGGSTTDLLNRVKDQGQLDAMLTVYNGRNQAQGLRNEAQLQMYSGFNSARASSNATTAGYIGAGARVLSGMANVYALGGNRSVPKGG